MSRKLRFSLLIAGGILLIGIGIVGGFWVASRKPISQTKNDLIPASISQNLSFPVYAPTSDSSWKIETSKTSYNQQDGILTLTLNNTDKQIILTQQATPQVFSDVPQQYPKLLATLNQYAEIQTSFGTVALTHPKELNGGQTAVSNKSGTLLFAKPNHDLSEDEWKAFFNALKLYKD